MWRATAIVLVILAAGVQLVPKEYAEAAEVFGATPWQRFVRITLPLLRPSIQTALILRTVLAFEMFATVLALGGRNFPVLMSQAFNAQYSEQNYGVAAAYAVVVMACLDRRHAGLSARCCARRRRNCHDAATRHVPGWGGDAVRLDAGADLPDRRSARSAARRW